STLERCELSGDVSQATCLRRNFVNVDEPFESVQNRVDRLNRIGGRVDADYGVSAAVEQAVKSGEQDSGHIIGGMVGLEANAENAALAHGVAAACDYPDL